MPQITYNRFWCTKCQDYTIQNTGEDGSCRTCGTVTKKYKLSDVPIEKQKEQRARYNKQKEDSMFNILAGIRRNPLEDMFRDVGSDVVINETDAGQIEIDNDWRKRMAEARVKRDELKKQYEIYRHTGRNDKCPCGSNLKYKKCCLSKFELI
jgi:uncharacterized protein YecA (UPF0149 family)